MPFKTSNIDRDRTRCLRISSLTIDSHSHRSWQGQRAPLIWVCRQIVGRGCCAATSDDEVATQVPPKVSRPYACEHWLHSRQGTEGERYSLDFDTELLYWTNYQLCWTNYHSERRSLAAARPAGTIPTENDAREMCKACIALLLAVGRKVCEKLVQVRLQELFYTYLSDNQSGFRKDDSTSHQLFRLVQIWSDTLDLQKLVGVVFFDRAKAFDNIWHRGLLAKLEAAGLRGGPLDRITSYLSN